MNEVNLMEEDFQMRMVGSGERISFRCQRCAECCRNVEDAVMIEPQDIYYLARCLRARGEVVDGLETLLDQYAHPVFITDGYPGFMLNTVGAEHACVFLKDGKCSVYSARPRVCRLYPFGVAPGDAGQEFRYYLCTDKPQHFGCGSVVAGDWISANISKETLEYLKNEYAILHEIGRMVRELDEAQFKALLFHFLFFRYFNYDLDKPFLPQYRKNCSELKALLSEERSNHVR